MINGGRAVFLDRDGTVVENVPYCCRPEDLRILPAAARAITLLNQEGFYVVIVTNQSGLARGYFDWPMLSKIHSKMTHELAGLGARVDAIYVCPHMPDATCACRKPRPGLVIRASTDLSIDLSRSYLVGDSLTDILAGKRSGCKTILIRTGTERVFSVPSDAAMPDYCAKDLYEATLWIVRR